MPNLDRTGPWPVYHKCPLPTLLVILEPHDQLLKSFGSISVKAHVLTIDERETGDLGSENNTWDVQVGGAFRWHIYLFVKLLLCLFLILYFLRADRADLLRQ